MSRKMILLLIVLGILLILAASAGAAWYFAMARGCNPPLPRANLTVGTHTFSVELATTMREQACGLSGRTGLADHDGMLFLFNRGSIQSFWMKDMSFPLDIIWISGGKVAGFAQNVDPQIGAPIWKLKIYTSPPNVDQVLEVNAGTVATDAIQIGDAVTQGAQ